MELANMESNNAKENGNVGFTSRFIGEKKRITILREDHQAKHQSWHVDSLQVGRKRAWFNAAIADLAAAEAKLVEAEDTPIDEETGHMRDTSAEAAEVVRLKRIVEKHQESVQKAEAKLEVLRIAKDKSAEELAVEEFLRGPLEAADKAFHAAHRAFQELAKSPYGAEFSIPWLNDELVNAWTAAKERRCNPPQRREIDPMSAIRFLRSTSGIGGVLDGRSYHPGEGAGFDPDTAARLVASGAAEYLIPNSQNAAAAEKARKQLALVDPRAGEPRVSVEMGTGMAAAANG